jgi:folylpolyglutamate synthase/dihydropteroate synthase
LRRQVEDARGTRLSSESFELLTLTSLRILEEAAVDIVILEVGMGGLLDATNIIATSTILQQQNPASRLPLWIWTIKRF